MKYCQMITKDALIELMKELELIYDVVRIVDPQETAVLQFVGDEVKRVQLEPCFSVWEKDKRCDNCISLRSCIEKKRMTKFEFRNDDIYSVVSMPFRLIMGENEHTVSLELVNYISEDLILQTHGSGQLTDKIRHINDKIYKDSLTKVFNRRYYDENLYIYEMTHTMPSTIGFLIIDVNGFKNINDTYGHVYGDELLVEVARILKQNIRVTDKVMRFGGDEFLIVLRDCNRLFAQRKIIQLKNAISQINFSWMNNFTVSIAVGLSFTEEFTGSKKQIQELCQEADSRMYEDKHSPAHEKQNLLMISNDLNNQEIVKDTFEHNHQIYLVDTDKKAYAILKQNAIEVVIIDSDQDGLAITKYIRKTPGIENIVILLIIAEGNYARLEALEAGVDEYVIKPIVPILLRHRLNGIIAQNTVYKRLNNK